MTNTSMTVRDEFLDPDVKIRFTPVSLLPCAIKAEFSIHERVNWHNRAHGARVKWQGHRIANMVDREGSKIPCVWETVYNPEHIENAVKTLHVVERVVEKALEISLPDSQLNVCFVRYDTEHAYIIATVEPVRPDWETFKK